MLTYPNTRRSFPLLIIVTTAAISGVPLPHTHHTTFGNRLVVDQGGGGVKMIRRCLQQRSMYEPLVPI